MDKLNSLSDLDLMQLKLSSLKLSLSKSWLWPLIERVCGELVAREIRVNPHFWISDEWFTPDGITGMAVPFYLLHPRLMQLERSQMGYVEGESKVDALKIIRHELGHIVDNAFKLRFDGQRREIFGKSSIRYPVGYSYRPYSKAFVRNLPDGYAQGHPVEDFAETFAIWLNPRSNWRLYYRDWPALKKLQFVDQLMKRLRKKRPLVVCKEKYLPLGELDYTLKQYYGKRRRREGLADDSFWNDGFFTKGCGGELVSKLIRKDRKNICREISERTTLPQYRVNQMLEDLLANSDGLVKKNVTTKEDLSYYLTKKMKAFVNEGRHIIAL